VTAGGTRAGAAAQAALGGNGGPGRLDKEWVAVLAEVPLFSGLSRRHLRRIAGLAKARRFEAGSTVIHAGRPGSTFYVILDGQARVELPKGKGVKLHVGDAFGEMSLLDDAPRSADVVAASELLVMEIGRTAFTKLLRREPQISLALLRVLAARLRLEG